MPAVQTRKPAKRSGRRWSRSGALDRERVRCGWLVRANAERELRAQILERGAKLRNDAIGLASLLLRQEQCRLTRSTDVMQGTLDLIILKSLSGEPMHAWGISARIRELSGGVFQIGQGSLYPAVHRFERRGWVSSYWRTTANNRIARYYQLTSDGRNALAKESTRWRHYVAAMDLVVEAR